MSTATMTRPRATRPAEQTDIVPLASVPAYASATAKLTALQRDLAGVEQQIADAEATTMPGITEQARDLLDGVVMTPAATARLPELRRQAAVLTEALAQQQLRVTRASQDASGAAARELRAETESHLIEVQRAMRALVAAIEGDRRHRARFRAAGYDDGYLHSIGPALFQPVGQRVTHVLQVMSEHLPA